MFTFVLFHLQKPSAYLVNLAFSRSQAGNPITIPQVLRVAAPAVFIWKCRYKYQQKTACVRRMSALNIEPISSRSNPDTIKIKIAILFIDVPTFMVALYNTVTVATSRVGGYPFIK